MVLEILVILAVLFLLAVLFYKQRRKDFQILQMETTQMEEQLDDLLQEDQPLVIRGATPPRGLTREGLQKIPRLGGFPAGGSTLSRILAEPSMLASAEGMPVLNQEHRELLAQELAMPVWAAKVWQAPFQASTVLGSVLGSLKTEATLGGLGLHRTTALYTMVLPGEGTYLVTIVSRASEDLLPTNWQYRYARTFTPNDTPLVGDIQYTDIVVRPGTALVLPKHTIVSFEPKDPSQFAAIGIVEYHTPISLLAKSFSQN